MELEMEKMLADILRFTERPPLFEPGEPRFWDDPHISRSMLDAHLNPEHDAASRRPEVIERTVAHFLASGGVKPGERLLDLGCGPGLYAQRLARAGVRVVGLDISRGSLDYALQQAEAEALQIDYRLQNFLEIDFKEEFDVVIQVYGELCVFPDPKRDRLLQKVHRALKPDGVLIFDVSTRVHRQRTQPRNNWRLEEGGFWRPWRYLLLEQGYDYPEADVWLDQYIVVDHQGTQVYRNWFHEYARETIEPPLIQAGFEIREVWNDLAGTPYQAGGAWIGLAAVKR